MLASVIVFLNLFSLVLVFRTFHFFVLVSIVINLLEFNLPNFLSFKLFNQILMMQLIQIIRLVSGFGFEDPKHSIDSHGTGLLDSNFKDGSRGG